jgi:hypothetical protein
MTRLAFALALPLLLSLPATARAADPAPAQGDPPALALGCAVARAVDVASVCRELAFFRREGEQRIGEELAALLDAIARDRALKLVDAELADQARKPVAGATCPAGRPLCAFATGALKALREGLAPEAR